MLEIYRKPKRADALFHVSLIYSCRVKYEAKGTLLMFFCGNTPFKQAEQIDSITDKTLPLTFYILEFFKSLT